MRKNNLEDEGYLRINDIDLNPEKTSKTIEEDMKDFKVNMFTKYNQICNQKVMYFNLQLLKIMSSYSKKTERFLKDIHRNGLKEEKKLLETIELYDKIELLRNDFGKKIDKTYEEDEMTKRNIQDRFPEDKKGRELFEEALRYREIVKKLYAGLLKDLQKVGYK